MENHRLSLQSLCRVCGQFIQKTKHSKWHFKGDFYNEFGELFGIELKYDRDDIHPNYVCSKDASVFYRYKEAKQAGKPYTTDMVPVIFSEHSEPCLVCNPPSLPLGRPKKRRFVGRIHKVPEKSELQHKKNEKSHPVLKHVNADSKRTIRCNHLTVQVECISCIILQFQKALCQETEKAKACVFDDLLNTIGNENVQILSFQIGLNERNKISKDANSFTLIYKDINTLSDFDLIRWLSQRNAVVQSFLRGIGNYSDIYSLEKEKLVVMASSVEQAYKICVPSVVCPFAFLQNLCLYTLTASKTAIDIFGKTRPSGGYKTVLSWLNDQSTIEPKCPEGEVMNVFDNEQVVGRKTGIKPNNKARVSVITNKGTTQLSDTCVLQTEEMFKPIQIFKMKEITKTETPMFAQRFRDTIMQIIDQECELYHQYETIHFEQVFHFIQLAIQQVKKEQQHEGNEIVDLIDQNVQTDKDSHLVICANCGETNSKRRKICVGCGTREGIQKTKEKEKESHESPSEPYISFHKIEFNVQEDRSVHISTSSGTTKDERYDHIISNHTGKKEIILSDPVFCNPNSTQTVALVLRQIGLENGISRYKGTNRKWTFVCCDGVPYLICKKLKEEAVICTENKCGKAFLTRQEHTKHVKDDHPESTQLSYVHEFDWFYLRIGAGHYEMNLIRSFFDLNWIPFLEVMCERMGFVSDAAKLYARNCKDLHKSWNLLLVFHFSVLRELVLPYVRSSMLQGKEATPKGFLQFSHTEYRSSNNTRYLMDQVLRFSQGIINFRMGTRRNNADLINSAKYMTKEIFHARNHPKYQQIELNDHLQHLFMPEEVKQLNDKFASITTSGNSYTGEDFDFVLEEKNRQLKQWMSKSVPTDNIWQKVCRNNVILQKIKVNTFSLLGVSSERNGSKDLDIEEAVCAFRTVIRKSRYLSQTGNHQSLTGHALDPELINCLDTATLKRIYFLKNSILQEDIEDLPGMSQPVPITPEERMKQQDICNMTKAMIEQEVLALLDILKDQDVFEYHQTYFKQKVKGKKKADLISFHTELKNLVAVMHLPTLVDESEGEANRDVSFALEDITAEEGNEVNAVLTSLL